MAIQFADVAHTSSVDAAPVEALFRAEGVTLTWLHMSSRLPYCYKWQGVQKPFAKYKAVSDAALYCCGPQARILHLAVG